ncbi:c-type cytochrome biogenesis protein CcmI [Amorphus sp. 3PC139-8]|uniref:c-type cytochrome biogenesis protein CcmI n=1 Tax=Amorphus sp. 3PC139-8 TaxID=2735676 RepID=UPI00345D5382
MVFWVLSVLLTAVAVFAVLWPMSRRNGHDGAESDPDVAVYRDQLVELDRDVDRGVIGAGEAEAARTEVARRLLRASRAAREATTPSRIRRRAVVIVALVAVPLVAAIIYARLGDPSYPDQPRAARLSASSDDAQGLPALVAKVEDHLAQDPDDARGWAVLGPVYLRLGRPNDAVAAYENAIRLGTATAELYAGLGEAVTQLNGGVVTDAAAAAFEQARALDPDAVKPRFFLALGLSQAGRTQEATEAWRALIASADGAEPWLPIARQQLAMLTGEEAQPAAPGPSAPGPSAAEVEAAAEMSDADRRAMVEGMVSRLATRLAEEGGSVDEWIRLMRAYQVIGQTDEAAQAARSAKAAYSDQPEAQARIEATERQLGLNQ